MSLSLANCKIQVARSLGGQNDPDELRAAGEAINEAISVWNRNNVWSFLLTDNLSNFTVPSKTTNASPTITLPTGVTYPNFSGVYVGTGVTGTGIPAGATVLTKASNSSFTIGVNGVAVNATASNDPTTLTFTGPIPIFNGQSDYALPYLLKQPSYARLVTSRTTLLYARSRLVNQTSDPTADGPTWGYMVVETQAATDSSNIYPATVAMLRLLSTPAGAVSATPVDFLVMEWFRKIQSFANDLSAGDEARLLDVPDEYVFALLDMAEYVYMANKDAETPRTADRKNSAFRSLMDCVDDDSGQADDITAFIPEIVWNTSRRSFHPDYWNNG